MTDASFSRSLLQRRVRNQLLEPPHAAHPEDVVRRLVAVQAQDYGGAAWAVGQRMQRGTRELVDGALDEGRLLRTHVLRPTWHLVTPADIRWLLDLTGPRVRRANRVQGRALGITDDMLERSCEIIAASLRGGHHLTRTELVEALADDGVTFTDFGHLLALQDAELGGLVCSGPWRGRQHTYALLEERVPPGRPRDHEEALAELATRYFTSHGPATLADFVWWSGLRVADARTGLNRAAPLLARDLVGAVEYWGPAGSGAEPPHRPVHLLSNFDEYTVGYSDRSPMLTPAWMAAGGSRSRALQRVVLHHGVIVGTWTASPQRRGASVVVDLDEQLPNSARVGLRRQLRRYEKFLGAPVVAAVTSP